MARPGLTTHRKFRRLVRVVGSIAVARGSLELLWDACYEAGEDYVGTAEDIEHMAAWDGEPGVLTRGLAEAGLPTGVGFIEQVEGVDGPPVYRVHDLWHHAPDYVAKRRKREIERQAKADPGCPPNGAVRRRLMECQDEVGRTPSPSHSPSPSPGKKNSAEPQELFEARGRVLLDFPTVGRVKTWQLSEAHIAEWATLFPGLDVLGECRKALAWVKASPGRRKTMRGMEKFLVGWFGRAVDNGRARTGQDIRRAAPTPEPVEWVCPHEPHCRHRSECRIVSMRQPS